MIRSGHRWSRLVIILFALSTALLSVIWRGMGGDGRAWSGVITGDAEGYHAYFEGLVVQGSLAHVRTSTHHFAPAGDSAVIKYFCGTAILQAPFTLSAHLFASRAGIGDGRSLPYAIAIMLAGWFYAVLGMIALRSLLIDLSFSDEAAAFALMVLAFGTGSPYYTVMTPGMSHMYGFAMLSVAFHSARRLAMQPGTGPLLRLFLSTALLILVRPTNALALLALPVVVMDHRAGIGAALRRIPVRTWIICAGSFLSVLLLQAGLWKVQSGRLLLVPYAGEGFEWGRPMLRSVLFGARKGLFFYWPLLLLALPGCVLLFKRDRLAGIALALAILLSAYVIGCWWNWYYGWSYGMRPFIDLLPVFAIPLAMVLESTRRVLARSILGVSILFMALQCFQLWQYQVGILHPYNMDREKYAMVFLRTGERWRGIFGWANQAPPFAPHGLRSVNEMDRGSGFAQHTADLGNGEFALDGTQPRSAVFITDPSLLNEGRPLHIQASLRSKAIDRGTTAFARLVCTYWRDGKEHERTDWPLNDLPLQDDRAWRPWRYAITLPAPRPGDELRCYLELTGPGRMLVRDPHIRVLVPADPA